MALKFSQPSPPATVAGITFANGAVSPASGYHVHVVIQDGKEKWLAYKHLEMIAEAFWRDYIRPKA